jgi:vacuolar-type H+-ATPase subunit D/Vma8
MPPKAPGKAAFAGELQELRQRYEEEKSAREALAQKCAGLKEEIVALTAEAEGLRESNAALKGQ